MFEPAHREAWLALVGLFLVDKPRRMAAAADRGLAPMQALALVNIDPDEGTAMSRIAETLICDPSNVTGIADRLETLGLVERRPAPHDRRLRLLFLTDAGRELQAAVKESMSTPPPGFAELSTAEAEQLAALLGRVRDAGTVVP